MKELFFKGKKIFEYDNYSAIQLIGTNKYLISLIIDLYTRIFSGYRYSDIDIDAMNGYYPELKEDGKLVNKKDMTVIRLSDLPEIIDQLTLKKNSILMKNVLSLNDEPSISDIIRKLEEVLIELSIDIENLLGSKLGLESFSIKADADNITFDRSVDSFIRLNFSIEDDDVRVPSWLLSEEQSIELLINLINLLIESGERITVIIDRLDSKLALSNYHKLINDLYKLTVENSNFNIWIIPNTKDGALLDYNIFESTFIINDDVFKFGNFDVTYDSICRNYPDNIYPCNEEVLTSLLQHYPFHRSDTQYYPSRELVIMSVFLEVLGETKEIKTLENGLTSLEKNFLTMN